MAGPVWRSKAPLAAATFMMAPSGANEPRTTRILPGGPSGWLTGLIASVVLVAGCTSRAGREGSGRRAGTDLAWYLGSGGVTLALLFPRRGR